MQYNRLPYGRLHRIMWFLNGYKDIPTYSFVSRFYIESRLSFVLFFRATKTILCNMNCQFFLIKEATATAASIAFFVAATPSICRLFLI